MENSKETKNEKFAYEMPEIVDITMPDVLLGKTGEEEQPDPDGE